MSETTYEGRALGLSVAFDYPGSWKLKTEEGKIDTYQLVRLLGPRNAEDTYSALISVRVSPVKDKGGRFGSLEEAVRHYTENLFPGSTLEVDQERALGGVAGREIVVSYVLPPTIRMHGGKNLPIPVRTRTTSLQQSGHFLEITYSADSREYEQYLGIADRLIESLRFAGP